MLHDAMESTLLDAGWPLKASDLAERINARELYRKKDGSPVKAGQVRLRALKYPHLFALVNETISLVRWDSSKQAQPSAPQSRRAGTAQPTYLSTHESPELELALLDPTAFKSAGTVDGEVPNRPGLYAIRVSDTNVLPEPFRSHSEIRGHDLIYVGIATRSLSRRFLSQELRGRGHGTFFRSIGAVLNYRPLVGSLVGKSNTRNYKFAPLDSQAIVEWINTNLLVNWVETSGAPKAQESAIIKGHRPLLNLDGNPDALPELCSLRADCVRIANLPHPH